MYELYRELIVKTTREKAWDFIKDPANLNKITPNDLSFEIITDLDGEMFEGMLVEYKVNIPGIHSLMSKKLVLTNFGTIIMELKRLIMV